MPTTPGWKAAENGPSNNLEAVNHAAQLTQFLGTHGITPVYDGVQLVTPGGGLNFSWLTYGTATDLDQPFTLPLGHTAIGRVMIPVNPVGGGADLLVTLCPDNGSGSPNTAAPLASTMVPASWINQLAAPTGISAGGPLARARYNTYYATGGLVRVPWAAPNPRTGAGLAASVLNNGNYIIVANDGPVSTANATVVSAQFKGIGALGPATPQPTIPAVVESGAFVATNDTVVWIGGDNAGIDQSAVYSASWNPNTGVISSWGTQAQLPQALSFICAATFNNFIYTAGGDNSNGGYNSVTNVYYATVTNNQITAWQSGPALPQALEQVFVAAVNGWLIVAGGNGPAPGGTTVTTTYFAKINADGSLGVWQNGPNLLTPTYPTNPGSNQVVTDSALILIKGSHTGSLTNVHLLQVLTVDAATGPSNQWVSTTWDLPNAFNGACGAFPLGSGTWQLINISFTNGWFDYTTVLPVPLISVPLPATGLTAGATYHVVLQQKPSTSASSYLQYGITNGALPTDAKKSTRHSGTWTTAVTGSSVPMIVFDNTTGNSITHTWEDPSSTGSTSSSNFSNRTTTLLYNRFSTLSGLCESVSLPNDPLNANPTFTSGVANWTPTNCTFVQSNAQVHGGFPFSGLMTPNGVAAAPNVTSESEPTVPFMPVATSGQWYAANGWFYSPTGWSTVSLSVNWYTSTQVFISTTAGPTTSLAAATWTNLVTFHQPPAGAAFAAINFIESGTPAASNTVFFSNVTISLANEMTQTLPSVTQVTYNSSSTPTGVTQLA